MALREETVGPFRAKIGIEGVIHGEQGQTTI
jgi:hypothetical protein